MPLRVLIITQDYPPGIHSGIGRHVQELASSLPGLGVEVCVVKAGHADCDGGQEGLLILGVEAPAGLFPIDREGGSDNLPLLMHINLAMIERILQISRASSYDLVHVHDVFAAPAGITIAHVLGLPIVFTKHFCLPPSETRQHRGDAMRYLMGLDEWSLAVADQVIAVSRYVQRTIVGRDSRLHGKCAVVTSGTSIGAVRSDGGRQASRERLAARLGVRPPLGFVLLHVSRLVYVKGADISLHALACLARDVPACDPRLVIVGTGLARIESYLRALASRLGVSDRVSLVGSEDSRDKLADLYRAADAVVVPSRVEPFNLVVAEAITLRCLVMAADAGGIPEQIAHMQNGLLFQHGGNPPASGKALAELVKWAVANPAAAARIAESGPLYGDETYSWPRVAAEVVRLYQHVTGQTA